MRLHFAFLTHIDYFSTHDEREKNHFAIFTPLMTFPGGTAFVVLFADFFDVIVFFTPGCEILGNTG